MKRIVHLSSIAPWDYGRMWRIARSLTKRYQVEIHGRAPFEHETIDGIEVYGYPGGQSFRERFERIKIFRRKMLANPPDAIQVNSPEQLPMLLELKWRKKVAAIFDSYEFYPDVAKFAPYAQGTLRQPIFQFVSNSVIPALARRADAIVCGDYPTGRYYASNKCDVVVPLINYLFKSELERTIPPRPIDHPELHHGGILSHDRGGALMLDALKILKERGTPVRMIFTGSSPTDPMLLPWEDVLRTRGIENLVEHRGYVSIEENNDLMATAKLALVLTKIERSSANFPQKIFYYLGWGVPIVITKMPALSEVLPADLPGVYYVPEKATAIADTISRVLSDEPARAEAGAKAREWICANALWEPQEEKLLALYERLLES